MKFFLLVVFILIWITGCDRIIAFDNHSSSEIEVTQRSSSHETSSESPIQNSSTPEGDESSSTIFVPSEFGTITADNPAFSYHGRIDFSDSKNPKFDWPGIYITANFEGTSLGIKLTGTDVYFDVFIDGVKIQTIDNSVVLGDATLKLTTGTNEYHIAEGLEDVIHTVKLAKRSETTWGTVTFSGFTLDAGKALYPADQTSGPKIEIIGDSYSVGYGNLSPSKSNSSIQDESGRSCTGDELQAFTNTHRTYGPLAAMQLNGEYVVNAYSGLGLVRNYNGSTSTTPFPGFYSKTLNSSSGGPSWDFGLWQPDVVVILLGTNDFSTVVGAGESFISTDDLKQQYKAYYHTFLNEIRANYPGVFIVSGAASMIPNEEIATLVKELIQEERQGGATDVSYFYFDNQTGFGCDWHPDVETNRLAGEKLAKLIDSVLSFNGNERTE